MSFFTEEDQLRKAYCENVNGNWERSMQRMLSDSEANLATMRERRDTLQHNCAWLAKKMRETVIGSDRYKILQNRLEKAKIDLDKQSEEFYRQKHRHSDLMKKYTMESRKRERDAKARFNGMTLEERLILARRMIEQGVAITICNRYVKAVREHERYGNAKVGPHSRHKDAQREPFQRSGYAEGRKIEVS